MPPHDFIICIKLSAFNIIILSQALFHNTHNYINIFHMTIKEKCAIICTWLSPIKTVVCYLAINTYKQQLRHIKRRTWGGGCWTNCRNFFHSNPRGPCYKEASVVCSHSICLISASICARHTMCVCMSHLCASESCMVLVQ